MPCVVKVGYSLGEILRLVYCWNPNRRQVWWPGIDVWSWHSKETMNTSFKKVDVDSFGRFYLCSFSSLHEQFCNEICLRFPLVTISYLIHKSNIRSINSVASNKWSFKVAHLQVLQCVQLAEFAGPAEWETILTLVVNIYIW